MVREALLPLPQRHQRPQPPLQQIILRIPSSISILKLNQLVSRLAKACMLMLNLFALKLRRPISEAVF